MAYGYIASTDPQEELWRPESCLDRSIQRAPQLQFSVSQGIRASLSYCYCAGFGGKRRPPMAPGLRANKVGFPGAVCHGLPQHSGVLSMVQGGRQRGIYLAWALAMRHFINGCERHGRFCREPFRPLPLLPVSGLRLQSSALARGEPPVWRSTRATGRVRVWVFICFAEVRHGQFASAVPIA